MSLEKFTTMIQITLYTSIKTIDLTLTYEESPWSERNI
jgi:hypothetical protein